MAETNGAALDKLLRDLRSEDWKISTQAQHSLARLGTVALLPLCELLEADTAVAWRAAWVLGRIRDPLAVPYLSDKLLRVQKDELNNSGPFSERRALLLAELAEALGTLGDAAGTAALCAALSSPSISVRKHAAAALERIGRGALPVLCASLEQLPAHGLVAVAKFLGKVGDARAVPPLCAVLDHPDWEVRWRATQALGALAPRYPVLALRAAIPHLERNQRGWNWMQEPLRLASKRTLKQVEAATAHLQFVPLPASSPGPDPEQLPLPADANELQPAESHCVSNDGFGNTLIEGPFKRFVKWLRLDERDEA